MRLYLLLIVILLSACTNLPSKISDVQVTEIPYGHAKLDIESFKNMPVRWGGVIVDVENEEEFSLVQVLFFPLGHYGYYDGRPLLHRPSEGRFVIKTSEFIDPMVYTKNREITAAGIVEGQIERTIGRKDLHIPLITSEAIHLWPNNQYRRSAYGSYGYPGYGGYSRRGFGRYRGFGGYGGFGGFRRGC